MGRRPKHAGDGPPAGATAPAGSPAKRAAERLDRVPRQRPGLEGWPPSHSCPSCKSTSYSAQDIRAAYCDRCKSFLAELELAYKRARLSAAYKKVPKA